MAPSLSHNIVFLNRILELAGSLLVHCEHLDGCPFHTAPHTHSFETRARPLLSLLYLMPDSVLPTTQLPQRAFIK